SMRNCRSEYFRRKTSACIFDSARLLVNVRIDSRASDSSLRSASFSFIGSGIGGKALSGAGDTPATTVSAFSILDSVKELFSSAANPRASIMQPSKIADFGLQITDLYRRDFAAL